MHIFDMYQEWASSAVAARMKWLSAISLMRFDLPVAREFLSASQSAREMASLLLQIRYSTDQE